MSEPKLVRDRIPEIIRASGSEPLIATATEAEYPHLLRAKLGEEVAEFLESGSPGELADILEVLLALGAEAGLDHAALERLRQQKAAERGAFLQRYVWSGNKP